MYLRDAVLLGAHQLLAVQEQQGQVPQVGHAEFGHGAAFGEISVMRTRSPASARVSHSGSACMGARMGMTVSAPRDWGLPARMLPRVFAMISTSATVGM
jgi:hypothetical protein